MASPSVIWSIRVKTCPVEFPFENTFILLIWVFQLLAVIIIQMEHMFRKTTPKIFYSHIFQTFNVIAQYFFQTKFHDLRVGFLKVLVPLPWKVMQIHLGVCVIYLILFLGRGGRHLQMICHFHSSRLYHWCLWREFHCCNTPEGSVKCKAEAKIEHSHESGQ